MLVVRWSCLLLALTAACAAPPPEQGPQAATNPAAPRAQVAVVLNAPDATAKTAPPLVDIPDESICESARSRDPFRAFDRKPPAPPPDLGKRKSKRYAVDQLKLVGLVTRTRTPRAMLVDPTGKGWVLTQGELVGRPEVVRANDDTTYAMSWRVDRIREGDVVLVREDALHPGAPMTTRVLALHAEPPSAEADD
jgi:type IV pilus assembly protein PilP